MFDEFQHPNGSLVGTAAAIGGTWVASTDPSIHVDPLIVGHQVTTVSGQTAIAVGGSTFTALQYQRDWYMRMVLVPTAQEADFKVFGLWLGRSDGAYYGILVTVQTGTGGANQLQINAGEFDGTSGSAIVTAAPLTGPHEIVGNYLAADQTFHVLVDDVEVLVVAAAAPDPASTREFSIYGNVGTVAAVPKFSLVEIGVGTYA